MSTLESIMNSPFNVSFNNKETFNEFEKYAIIKMLKNYYLVSEGFKSRMDFEYNQINVIKATHLNDEDNRPHFNIQLYNNFSLVHRTAQKPSGIGHCYTDYVSILCITEKIRY